MADAPYSPEERIKLRKAWFAATDEYLAAPKGPEKEALGDKADAICFKYFRGVDNGVPASDADNKLLDSVVR